MAARLTDEQKKKIIADYVQLGSYNATAKANGVSDKTVRNIVLQNPDISEKLEQKKSTEHRRHPVLHGEQAGCGVQYHRDRA